MKDLTYILLITSILTSCSNYGDNNSLSSTSETKHDTEKLKKNFTPYFTGVWTLSEYIDDLTQTKSPLKSYDKLTAVSEIVFSETTNNDTLLVASGLNNHEGFSFNIIFNKGLTKNSLKTDIADYYYNNKDGFCDIQVETSNSDTTLNSCIYNSDNSLLKKVAFKKIRANQPKDDFYAYGLSYFANKILFAGQYVVLDTNQTACNVEFKADGQINGHAHYKNFSVTTDFGTLPENNLDNILLYKAELDFDVYLYKFSGDTINLYRPIFVDEEMIEYGYGNLVYKMVRQE